jgi:hypothetical protein
VDEIRSSLMMSSIIKHKMSEIQYPSPTTGVTNLNVTVVAVATVGECWRLQETRVWFSTAVVALKT